MTYIPPTATNIQIVFNCSDYVPPIGTDLNIVFQSAYIEICEESLNILHNSLPIIRSLECVNDVLESIDISALSITFQPTINEAFQVNINESSKVEFQSITSDEFEFLEILIGYIPTGIIYLLSNPFILSAVEAVIVELEEIQSDQVNVEALSSDSIVLTKIEDGIDIEEVYGNSNNSIKGIWD